jgi:uncharacterized protein (TIGR02466 family)
MQIIELFKQFVVKIPLKQNLKKLSDFSNKIFDKQKGRNVSNFGGFQSNDLKIEEPVLNSLIKEIELNSNIINDTILKINSRLSLKNIWININKFKDFNIIHNHPFSKLSGVFYIKIPENSGDLLFANETEIGCFIKNEDIIEFNNYNSSTWSIKPEENVLYLFPSWLNHYVKPNLSNEKRISISFNLS